MKIAFTAQGTDWNAKVDPRFGRTRYILLYDEDSGELQVIDNSASVAEAHGAGPKTAALIADYDPDVLITGNGPGGNADPALRAMGIEIFTGAGGMTIRQAYEAYKNNQLRKF